MFQVLYNCLHSDIFFLRQKIIGPENKREPNNTVILSSRGNKTSKDRRPVIQEYTADQVSLEYALPVFAKCR